jgi:hypothetical protein
MGKHKHKQKKHHAKYQAHNEANAVALMNTKEITPENQTETTANVGKEAAKNEKPSLGKRFIDWMKKDKTFTDWCIAAFTFVLAGAAIYQFVIMGSQLDTMRKDQRPWLDLTFTTNSNALQVGDPITAMAHVVNNGKTPARAITGDVVIEMIKNGEKSKLNYPLPHSRFTVGALFPNRPMDSPVFSRVRTASDGISVEANPVSQAELDDFNQVKSFIIVYGIVSYRDFFGTWHWTKICGYFPKPNATGGVTAKWCADYGDIDGD